MTYAPDTIELIFAGTHERTENVRPHAHPCRELILIVEGQCEVEAEEHTLHAGAGDLIRMPARVMHNQVSEGFIRTLYAGFSHDSPDFPWPQVLHLDETELIQQAMRTLARSHMHQFAACPEAISALLVAVVAEVNHQGRQPRDEPRLPIQIQAVLRYIEQNAQDPITIDEIAAHARMSASNLHRLFREHLDTSPIRHLTRIRMQRARKLLYDPYLSVKEVARYCGYPDNNLFVRTFRKAHGVPPGKWRTEHVAGSGPELDPR